MARRPSVSRTAKISIAFAVTVAVVSVGGASFARNAGRSVAGSTGGGSSPGVTDPGTPGDTSPGSGGGVGDEPCGTTTTSGSGADATVAYTPCPRGEAPPVHPQIVEPTPGMADVRARPFDSATVGADGTTVSIDFWSGVEPCSVLDHVAIAYGADTVTITLFEGHDPSAGDVACIDIAMLKRVVITLDQPLGGRAIVDGAS
jgi:hypothetical protein